MPEHSPLRQNRTCSDIPCTILFIAFIFGWIIVAFLAHASGSIRRLVMPSDTDGRICGVDKGFEDKNNLLFFDLSKCAAPNVAIFGCPTPQMCVEKCPDTYFYGAIPLKEAGVHLSKETEKKLKKNLRYCLPHADQGMPYTRLADGYHCAAWYVPSQPIGGRCLPKTIAGAINKLTNMSKHFQRDVHKTEQRAMLRMVSRKGVTTELNNTLANGTKPNITHPMPDTPIAPLVNETDDLEAMASDGTHITKAMLQSAKAALSNMRFVVGHFSLLTFLSLLFPLLLSLMYVLLMRWSVGPVIWAGLLGSLAALAAVTAICASRYYELSQAPTSNRTIKDVGLTTDTRQYTETKGLWLVLTIVAAVVTLLVLILIIALRKKIMLAIALLKQCSIAMRHMVTLLLVPVVSFTLQVLALLVFVSVMLTLFGTVHQWKVTGNCYECESYATGDFCYPTDFHNHCHDECPKAQCKSTQRIELYVYNALAIVWAVGFISAVNQISVAMSYCCWYFSRTAIFSLMLPFTSYGRTLMFHTGTAAFGSLIIAICQLVRWVLEQGKRQLERRGGMLARCCMCCCICCCWCLQNCLQFINRRAYIVTALEGSGLCTGARKGLQVVLKNISLVAVADSVTALALGLGKLLVVVSSVVLCHYSLLESTSDVVPWLLPTIYSALLAWIVASMTFSLYDMGVDTIFYCVMVDLDVNDGSTRKPYMMSKGIADALGVANRPAPPGPQATVATQVPDQSQQATRADQTARQPTPTDFQQPGLTSADRESPETPVLMHRTQI